MPPVLSLGSSYTVGRGRARAGGVLAAARLLERCRSRAAACVEYQARAFCAMLSEYAAPPAHSPLFPLAAAATVLFGFKPARRAPPVSQQASQQERKSRPNWPNKFPYTWRAPAPCLFSRYTRLDKSIRRLLVATSSAGRGSSLEQTLSNFASLSPESPNELIRSRRRQSLRKPLDWSARVGDKRWPLLKGRKLASRGAHFCI